MNTGSTAETAFTAKPVAGSFANSGTEMQSIDVLCKRTTHTFTPDTFAKDITNGPLAASRAKGYTITNEQEFVANGRNAYKYNSEKR